MAIAVEFGVFRVYRSIETASAAENVRVSDWVESSRYEAISDDALKDEDNAAWVIQLEPEVRQCWLERIHWIRLADRLAENELLHRPECRFSQFLEDWQSLRDRASVRSGCPFESVFGSMATCWFSQPIDPVCRHSIAAWTAYLDALSDYHRADGILERLEDYHRMLDRLAGQFFQIFPFLTPEDWESARAFGILDQFYNNLRDLAEDARQGICYFPREILERFGVDRSEILQFQCFDNPGYSQLMKFWLDEYLPRLRQNTERFAPSERLHPSWEILRSWSMERYHRIEGTFRSLEFDYARFPPAYWATVRQYLARPHESSDTSSRLKS